MLSIEPGLGTNADVHKHHCSEPIGVIRRSNNPDEILASLSIAYREVSDLRVRKEFRTADYAFNKITLKNGVIRRFSKGGYGFTAVARDRFLLGFSTAGGVKIKSAYEEVETKPFAVGDTIRADRTFSVDVMPKSNLIMFDMPTEVVNSYAAAFFGHRKYRGAESLSVNLSATAGAALMRNILHMFHEAEWLGSTGIGIAGLATFEEHLLNLAVCATRPDLVEQNRVAEPSQLIVRRAMEYLSAHATHNVRIGDVAKDMHVSIRTLQVAFARHGGSTPLGFLIRCRLDRAHERLLSAQSHDSVASIAAECGFTSLSAFSQRYRATFGTRPSDVLRRAAANGKWK